MPTLHRTFGWVVAKTELAAGESHRARYEKDVRSMSADNSVVISSGRVAMSYNHPVPPGWRTELRAGETSALDSIGLPDRVLKAGSQITWTALEPTEFWCFSTSVNGGVMPALEKFLMTSGNQAAAGPCNIFLMSGELTTEGQTFTGPKSIKLTKAVTLLASRDCIGVVINSERGSV